MSSPNYDSRTADKFVVRLPDGLRAEIEAAANADDRSMNSVFVRAVRQYLDGQHQQQILLSVLANAVATPTQPSPAGIVPPAIGEYWPGQGGIYGGRREYPEGLCHVVFAAEDVGGHAWSKTGFDLVTSRTDGRANTAALIDHDAPSPAAETAVNYTADGHQDFYLPSIGELSHAWLYIPESFANEAYWSSSQRSAYSAFDMYFGDGFQDTNAKFYELRVRPVRRLPI
ncbi:MULTISPECIES: Arc family DNA-binding protein [unclassified Pseudomonas]|uniref:Arc family DNA-binding protein n=1 Tax=unclassified Pseudomonas TaxID=196821 RepID=UPI000C88650B|nr:MULTISPECIES: Arc family DNA-binding protein [unclassified Pseudomonas]PMX29271.1 DUF1566 domain-containing protein [Pseudomonas sp. GW460-12]PMX36872.1 DUF1566 domain-containing protein [Pseudomonas sp. MPR-R2A4]PMX43268.1 DUF1566 domain-containing protein [Pseudomonas sp. MPR-R2A7]PMX53331.1 DUF1566 domain-containing protein [Pseudomonas sp. MPR-R2A6]PMX93393.1 DUF1566 domain-containing protein [Pseudomonas sp. MPR-R2A3]